jgi:hypothetical protein
MRSGWLPRSKSNKNAMYEALDRKRMCLGVLNAVAWYAGLQMWSLVRGPGEGRSAGADVSSGNCSGGKPQEGRVAGRYGRCGMMSQCVWLVGLPMWGLGGEAA